jgi:hypothetical protein
MFGGRAALSLCPALAVAFLIAEAACFPRESLSSYADEPSAAAGSGGAPVLDSGTPVPQPDASVGDASTPAPDDTADAGVLPDAALDAADPTPCPTPDALFDAVSSSCYQVVSTPLLAWNAAEQACSAWAPGATLALVGSVRENDFLASAVPQLTFWLGASDLDSNGSYVWPDGSAVSPDFGWESTQPDEPIRAGGNCVELRLGTGGLWFDRPCSILNAHVCELTVVQ